MTIIFTYLCPTFTWMTFMVFRYLIQIEIDKQSILDISIKLFWSRLFSILVKLDDKTKLGISLTCQHLFETFSKQHSCNSNQHVDPDPYNCCSFNTTYVQRDEKTKMFSTWPPTIASYWESTVHHYEK